MADGFSSADVVRLRAMMDRIEIRETIERYFFGDDRKDRKALLDTFAPDAEGHFDGPKGLHTMKGREQMVDGILKGIADKLHLNHLLSNCQIDVEGDRARADTHAIATVVIGIDRPALVMVRGLRYMDELVRLPEGWRIQKRVHKALWQYEVAAVPPIVKSPADLAKMGLPKP